jgi:hypothetical protein
MAASVLFLWKEFQEKRKDKARRLGEGQADVQTDQEATATGDVEVEFHEPARTLSRTISRTISRTLSRTTSRSSRHRGGTLKDPFVKNHKLLWAWDFFDTYTFGLVGQDVYRKSKPEHLTALFIFFNIVVIAGFMIPVVLNLWKKNDLTWYVSVEFFYDLVQGAIVTYFTQLDVGFLRDDEKIDNCLILLSLFTSTVDVLLIKGPAGLMEQFE